MKHPTVVMKHIVIDRLIIYWSAQSYKLISFQRQQFLTGFLTDPTRMRRTDNSHTAKQSFNCWQ